MADREEFAEKLLQEVGVYVDAVKRVTDHVERIRASEELLRERVRLAAETAKVNFAAAVDAVITQWEEQMDTEQVDLDAVTQGLADDADKVASAIVTMVGTAATMQTQIDDLNWKVQANAALKAAVGTDVQALQASKQKLDDALASIPGTPNPPPSP